VGAARLSQHCECLSQTPTNARDRAPIGLNVSRETCHCPLLLPAAIRRPSAISQKKTTFLMFRAKH
ncbi:MAG: hypothetical protein MPL62_07450, partial [Alphaproteobacteria bacterium]|nr:hypothetical protein [Alphaproteobacteria bacterium]